MNYHSGILYAIFGKHILYVYIVLLCYLKEGYLVLLLGIPGIWHSLPDGAAYSLISSKYFSILWIMTFCCTWPFSNGDGSIVMNIYHFV